MRPAKSESLGVDPAICFKSPSGDSDRSGDSGMVRFKNLTQTSGVRLPWNISLK